MSACTGTPFSCGDDFTVGATGRGSVTLGGATSTHIVTDATAGNARYRYDNGRWKVSLVADKSRAEGSYRDQSEGHFRQLAISLRNPSRIVLRNINDMHPETLQFFDNTNREVDLYDINNYQLTTVNSTPRKTREDFESGSADVGRTLDFLPFPVSVQIGAQQRTQTRDIRRRNENWTYNGINGDRSPAPFRSPVNQGQYHYYGFRNVPHLSPMLAWDAYQAIPALFTKTAAQLVTEETFRINNSQLLRPLARILHEERRRDQRRIFSQRDLRLLRRHRAHRHRGRRGRARPRSALHRLAGQHPGERRIGARLRRRTQPPPVIARTGRLGPERERVHQRHEAAARGPEREVVQRLHAGNAELGFQL